jgi:hypothetical protein
MQLTLHLSSPMAAHFSRGFVDAHNYQRLDAGLSLTDSQTEVADKSEFVV